MTIAQQKVIGQFRRQLQVLLLAKYLLAALTIWAFLLGTVTLTLRSALGYTSEQLGWGLLSFPLAVLPACWLAWRHFPSDERICALLDQRSRCGGLLMTSNEIPIGEWSQQIASVRLPALSWRKQQPFALLGCGFSLLLFAFLLPQSITNFAGNSLDVTREVKKLNDQLDVLEKEKLLEQPRANQLKSSLEQVRREAKGRDPIKTLESLDHLQQVANKTARDAAEAAIRRMEELARVEAFAKALDRIGNKMTKQQLSEAMHELAAITKKLANENEKLLPHLDKETLEAIKNSSLTPEQAKKLMEALKNAKEDTKDVVARLAKAQLVKAEDLEKCDKAGKCDCDGLMAFLKDNGTKSDLTAMLTEGLGEEGGEGGINEGPGAAKLSFGDESSLAGTKFKEKELPAAQLQQLKNSELTGVSTGAPNLGKEKAQQGASGALLGAESGAGSANTQVVLPQHRGTVRRYFDRATMPKK